MRLAAEEREKNLDKGWFVARVDENPKKLGEAGVYTVVRYNKGDWIIFVRWHVFDASKVDGSGDRFYKKELFQWIPCESIVKGVRSEVKLPWVGQCYWLSSGLVEDIEEYGDVSV